MRTGYENLNDVLERPGTVIVTGAAGFIGWKTSETLLRAGWTVIGVDNLNEAYDVRLKNWRVEQLKQFSSFELLRLDICEKDGLRGVFQSAKPRAVINLAARAGVRQSVRIPEEYFRTNVLGTLSLLELCREYGVGKFVQASSSSVYGDQKEQPFKEEMKTDCPLSPYAASKKASEALCYSYHCLHGIDVTVFRYFTVYGPAGRPDMSPFRFVQWISEGRPVTVYGDGSQQRDFTYVEDIARGTFLGLKRVGFETVNLGSDRPVVLLDAIQIIEESLGRQADLRFEPPQPGDVRATWADISKARSLIGWGPLTDFRGGIAKLARWYLRNQSWAKRVRTEN